MSDREQRDLAVSVRDTSWLNISLSKLRRIKAILEEKPCLM